MRATIIKSVDDVVYAETPIGTHRLDKDRFWQFIGEPIEISQEDMDEMKYYKEVLDLYFPL